MRLVSALYDDFYPFIGMFPDLPCEVVRFPEEMRQGDILIVWGGADIHPSLYKHGRSSKSGAYKTPSPRDVSEWNLMIAAKELGCPIIGVCRGAQMLCALAGGSLVQHVNGHVMDNHLVRTFDDHMLQVNSIHHQMMNPDGTNHTVVAATVMPLSDTYHLMKDGKERVLRNLFSAEPEFVHFHDVHGFAVQWHPEMMNDESEATEYISRYIQKHVAQILAQ